MRKSGAIVRELQQKYKKVSKKEREIILDQLASLTGYSHLYIAKILRLAKGKVIRYTKICGKKVKFVIGKNKKKKRKGEKVFIIILEA